VTLINEEVNRKSYTLEKIINMLCDFIIARHLMGKDYGAVLIPESLLMHIPEFNQLLT